MLRKLVLIVLLSFSLAGCAAVGGSYQPPVPKVPQAFATYEAQGLAEEPVAETRWWKRFGDPVLDGLVDRALGGNLDLREAVARVEAARAVRREARQGFFPTGGVFARHEEGRLSESQALGGERRIETAAAGLDVGWEIDLFGRVRSANRAAEARLGGTEALLAQARLAVAAEVGRIWFALRGTEARVALLERVRDDQISLVEIVAARVEEGLGDEADLARARAALAGDTAALAAERHAARVLTHSLAVLLGEAPGAWTPPAAAELEVPLTVEPIALGDPAGLLRRRPDVRIAERTLAAETAEIGIATADLFPQVRLGGFLGFVAGGFGHLGGSASESWSAGPTISWGLFDLGRTRARIRSSKAEAEAALAAYEGAVLRALEDAQNAFSALAAAQTTLGATDDQAREARRAEELVEARYLEGVAAYFELLDARRSAVSANIARIDGLTGHRIATVDVFRALGQGPEEASSSAAVKEAP